MTGSNIIIVGCIVFLSITAQADPKWSASIVFSSDRNHHTNYYPAPLSRFELQEEYFIYELAKISGSSVSHVRYLHKKHGHWAVVIRQLHISSNSYRYRHAWKRFNGEKRHNHRKFSGHTSGRLVIGIR